MPPSWSNRWSAARCAPGGADGGTTRAAGSVRSPLSSAGNRSRRTRIGRLGAPDEETARRADSGSGRTPHRVSRVRSQDGYAGCGGGSPWSDGPYRPPVGPFLVCHTDLGPAGNRPGEAPTQGTRQAPPEAIRAHGQSAMTGPGVTRGSKPVAEAPQGRGHVRRHASRRSLLARIVALVRTGLVASSALAAYTTLGWLLAVPLTR